MAAAVTAFAAPLFAFFLPTIFSVVVCLGLGIVAYDIFNMADNLGDAARQSAEGFKPLHPRPNIKNPEVRTSHRQKTQATEVSIKMDVLNQMTELGMPKSYTIRRK